MSSRARREREKENMKNAILEAAIKIIIAEGYDNLSMRKVASAIEYTPTTIYSYYKDKAEIIDEIARQVYDKIISNTKMALEENEENALDEQLKAAFKAFLYTMADYSKMSSAVMRSGTRAIFGPRDESMVQEDNGILSLNNLLIQGQQKSIFRKLDVNTSWMLITALLGFAINCIENQLHMNEQWSHLVDSYVDILIHGLLIRDN